MHQQCQLAHNSAVGCMHRACTVPSVPGVTACVAAVLPPQPQGSYDVVFSNWLLMYLSDAEVKALAAKILTWVRLCALVL